MPLDAELIAVAWQCDVGISEPGRKTVAALARRAAREIQRQRRGIEALEKRLANPRADTGIAC